MSFHITELQKIQKSTKGFFKGIIPVDFAGLPVDLEAFRSLADQHGLWIIEDACHAPGGGFTDSNGNPGTEIASEVQKGCIDKGLLLLTCGTYLNIIRWIPPLIVSKKEIDKVLEIFSSVVTKYKKEKY